MNAKSLLGPLFLVLMLGAVPVLAGDFVAYEGKDSLKEGTGGEKKTVDGIDFWSNGTPPRKFKVMGYINDTRLKTGLIGKFRMSGLESSIAKQVKQVAGDAVILVDASAETNGYVGQSNTSAQATATGNGNTVTAYGSSSTTAVATAVQHEHTRYAVIKYVDDSTSIRTDTQAH